MRFCARVLLLWLFSLAAIGSASAGPDRWNGAYVGLNAGYGFSNLDGGIAVLDTVGRPYGSGPLGYGVDGKGLLGGIQAGINSRSGMFFSGIEADLQWADISDTSKTSFAPPVIFPFTYTATSRINGLATIRARAGIALDSTLIYVTGGFALGKAEYEAQYFITSNNAYANLRSSDILKGYVLGAGVEQALGGAWSLKLEYQYINFGDQVAQGGLHFANGTPSGETVTTGFDMDLHTVRVGLNYKFSSMSP